MSDAQWREVTRHVGNRWLRLAALAWENYELLGPEYWE